MGHCIMMKLDFNSCSHIEQCLMEDEFSFRKEIGMRFDIKSIDKAQFPYGLN